VKNRPATTPLSPAVLLSLALLVSTGSLAASHGLLTPWVTAPTSHTVRSVALVPDEPDDLNNAGGWMESISRVARQFQGLQHQLLAILHGDAPRLTPVPARSDQPPPPEPTPASALCLIRAHLLNLPPPARA